MSLTAWAQGHARSILFLLAALVLAGVVATFALPVALFPHVDFPRVRITLDAGDRPAEQMAIEVTTPVDDGKPVGIPLDVHAELTPDPKGLDDFPKAARLNATLDAIVTAAGKFVVKQFTASH